MPVLTDAHKSVIGRELGPRPTPYPVNVAMARFWCEMVEDENPIYFDEAYARSTWLHGTFAPPPMLVAWRLYPVWPEVKRESPLDWLELPDCPATIAVNAVQEYFMPVRYGDTLTFTSQVVGLSEEKTTWLGTGHFVSIMDTFHNQHGQAIGTHTFNLFVYKPAPREEGK